jgi:hypothetical protein
MYKITILQKNQNSQANIESVDKFLIERIKRQRFNLKSPLKRQLASPQIY